MITEDHVSFETAKLLKEKGFDEPCKSFYGNYITINVSSYYKTVELVTDIQYHRQFEQVPVSDTLTFIGDNGIVKNIDVKEVKIILAPTLQMAMKWLREVHNIAIQVFPVIAEDTWSFDVYKKDDEGIWKSEPENLSDIDFGLYEECLNAALVYTLENLV